jgi:hypothetical protein
MRGVDCFIGGAPVGQFQYFSSFNKSIIQFIAIPFSVAREGVVDEFSKDLIKFHKNKKNILISNNVYHKYHTELFLGKFFYKKGINVQYVPSLCNYTNVFYNLNQKKKIFHLSKGSDPSLIHSIKKYNKNVEVEFKGFNFETLANYSGIIYIPYTVSVMSMYEQFSMNIPMFLPSKKFLIDSGLYRSIVHLTQVVSLGSNLKNQDLYNETFLGYCDWFSKKRFKYLYYFDSVEHLSKMLDEVSLDDLRNTSLKMNIFNKNLENNLKITWVNILYNLLK